MFECMVNAINAGHSFVDIRHSKFHLRISDALFRLGLISFSIVVSEKDKKAIRINFKFNSDGVNFITGIKFVSVPGSRKYCDRHGVKSVLQGFGTSLISTSRGVLSCEEARALGVGGEYLCQIF